MRARLPADEREVRPLQASSPRQGETASDFDLSLSKDFLNFGFIFKVFEMICAGFDCDGSKVPPGVLPMRPLRHRSRRSSLPHLRRLGECHRWSGVTSVFCQCHSHISGKLKRADILLEM